MPTRYEQLASQFATRSSHQQNVRKHQINSKFQWLMKYLHQEKLPSRLKPNPEQQVCKREQEKENGCFRSTSWKSRKREKPEWFCPTQSVTLNKLGVKKRVCTQPIDSPIFRHKSNGNNRNILIQQQRELVKTRTFFGKQNTHLKLRVKPKISQLDRKRAVTCDNFILSPWGHNEQSNEQSDLTTYC